VTTAATPEVPAFRGLLVAHRGRCGGLPENSIEALGALPAWVDAVEVDVRATRDGVPVLMHDPTVDRTTTGTGRVAELPAVDVLGLSRPDTARVPTLAGYLTACHDRDVGTILLDLKAPGATGLAALVDLVRASPVSARCILLVRDDRHLGRLRALGADLRLGWFGATRDAIDDQLRSAVRHGAEIVFVHHGDEAYLAHRGVVPAIRARGLIAGASTVNRVDALTAAVRDGCGAILTDVADRLGAGRGR
jgi:glycerophosphoryl diester phosphodiesterase